MGILGDNIYREYGEWEYGERIFTGNMGSGNTRREYLQGIWGVGLLGENIYREYGDGSGNIGSCGNENVETETE